MGCAAWGAGAELGWSLPMWLGRQEELVWNSSQGTCTDILRWLCSQGSHSIFMGHLLCVRWHAGAVRCYRIQTASALQTFLMGSQRLGIKCSGQMWGSGVLKREWAVTQQTGWGVALTAWSQCRPHRVKGSVHKTTRTSHVSHSSGGIQATGTSD